jgi:hypothetical protein
MAGTNRFSGLASRTMHGEARIFASSPDVGGTCVVKAMPAWPKWILTEFGRYSEGTSQKARQCGWSRRAGTRPSRTLFQQIYKCEQSDDSDLTGQSLDLVIVSYAAQHSGFTRRHSIPIDLSFCVHSLQHRAKQVTRSARAQKVAGMPPSCRDFH